MIDATVFLAIFVLNWMQLCVPPVAAKVQAAEYEQENCEGDRDCDDDDHVHRKHWTRHLPWWSRYGCEKKVLLRAYYYSGEISQLATGCIRNWLATSHGATLLFYKLMARLSSRACWQVVETCREAVELQLVEKARASLSKICCQKWNFMSHQKKVWIRPGKINCLWIYVNSTYFLQYRSSEQNVRKPRAAVGTCLAGNSLNGTFSGQWTFVHKFFSLRNCTMNNRTGCPSPLNLWLHHVTTTQISAERAVRFLLLYTT